MTRSLLLLLDACEYFSAYVMKVEHYIRIDDQMINLRIKYIHE